MKIEATSFYRRIDGLESNEVDGGYVIYDPSREQAHFLNVSAATVLELCDGKSNSETIARILQEGFSLPDPPTADVEACLASLASQALIEPSR